MACCACCASWLPFRLCHGWGSASHLRTSSGQMEGNDAAGGSGGPWRQHIRGCLPLGAPPCRHPCPHLPPHPGRRFAEISAALRLAGELARLYGQRVTFHPRCVAGAGPRAVGSDAALSPAPLAHLMCMPPALSGQRFLATRPRATTRAPVPARPPLALQPLCEAGST